MAQAAGLAVGQKRGADRLSTGDTPAAKRLRLATHVPPSPLASSPGLDTPTLEKKAIKLRSKVLDNKPLPSLPAPQALSLSNDEYQSIAASAVLQASLDRSRSRWISEGVFERYWVKAESGKNARPPPPKNPDLKWMKHKGECRIRVEPHIFQAEMYIEERVKTPLPPKQYASTPSQSAYGQPYRQQPYQPPQNVQFQSRTLPSIHQALQQDNKALPPIDHLTQSPANAPTPPASKALQPHPLQPDKKSNPDPVISMLAARASSNPELKALMKEVATGNANQEQLKIFQRHIDELGDIVSKQREEDAEREKREAEQAKPYGDTIQHDDPAESKPQQVPLPPKPYVQTQSTSYPQSQTFAPPPPVPQPVIIGFTTPGATEDRFLFPQNSVLESLSPQHVLASFIVVRTGRDAVSPTGLMPDTEYWQPVTILIEVQYGKEFLLDCVKRWVKPAEEAKKHMEATMKRCIRAPETFLALRLPVKGSAMAETDDAMSTRDATPAVVDEKPKVKSNVKYFKQATAAKPKAPTTPALKKPEPPLPTAQATPLSAGPSKVLGDPSSGGTPATVDGKAVVAEDPAVTESGRPKRTIRKSVRISEG